MNIKILFDTLDTSIIIKLWTAILTEKQVNNPIIDKFDCYLHLIFTK